MFYDRLKEYFEKVASVLRGQADSASIFPNTSDKGTSRELIFIKFLQQHIPSKCDAFLGGFLFGKNGDESRQLDVIITTDSVPRYNFHNQDGKGKSFCSVDGCIGVASVKSKLDKKELLDSLDLFASIPEQKELDDNQMASSFSLDNYEDWPYKIVYASDGLELKTIIKHLDNFYTTNRVSLYRRPNIIYVPGKYVIYRDMQTTIV
ncbi:MAG: DUF6602 domain-containing protein [Dysgonomonas sp.]|nr:DUF6602 domain-containing protein [Dysgonomonas sp.]